MRQRTSTRRLAASRHSPDAARSSTPGQYGLARATALHLVPGAVLVVFIVLVAPLAAAWGMPAVFVLFLGIPLVLVPLEIGYLVLCARRETGSWSPLAVVDYRQNLPSRRHLLWPPVLAGWFLLCYLASAAVVDEWLATTVFSWMPESLLQFATVAQDEPLSGAALTVLLVVAFVFNGVVGPVTEELYFRGHLLARMDRLGRWAPVLNTVLFGVYHAFSPWKWPAIIIGFLPMAWVAWRTRNVRLTVVAHVLTNVLFLVFLTASFTEATA